MEEEEDDDDDEVFWYRHGSELLLRILDAEV